MNTRQKVIVTGASSGIGRATAIRFAKAGWDICMNARNHDRMRELMAAFPQGDHLICIGDYSEPNVAAAISDTLRSRWGRVDALVNSAGIFQPVPVVASPLEVWRSQFDSMINGAVQMTRAAVPLMSSGGRIIHFSSIHGMRAEANASAYAMAKAAINALCRGLALELALNGILVNAIAPGFIDTPMSVINGVNELESEWFKKNYVEGHHLPLRRPGQPEEVAGLALFLAGPDATYITGQVIAVDGGLSITF